MSQESRGEPMVILDDESERIKDRDAQEYNINAVRAVADTVRSTLGPKGMDKLVISEHGKVVVTNDGATILEEMDIDNPTAEMIVEVAQTQEGEAGDGTTTAVALAGELLARAEDLIEQDLHPTSIIRGYNLAFQKAREIVGDLGQPVDPDDEEMMKKVAETCMTGKGVEANKAFLSDLLVEAIGRVTVESDQGGTVVDLDYINMAHQPGLSVTKSEVFDGLVLDKDPDHDSMPRDIEDARAVLIDSPFEVEETAMDARIDIEDREQLKRFVEHEEQQFAEKVSKLKDLGVNVVFCSQLVDEVARHYLAKEGILSFRRMKQTDMAFLKDNLEIPLVTDIDSATEDDVGPCSVRYNDSHEAFYVESKIEDAHGVTLVVRGGTQKVMMEIDRSLRDALDVVTQAMVGETVVAGGGAVEVEVARRLRDYAEGIGDREQLAVDAFADSLELVPRVLAANSGLDPVDALVDLRAAHEAGEERAGLDVSSGEVVDAFEADVVEPHQVKVQAFASAMEAANLVLKIDDIIAASELDPESANDPDVDFEELEEEYGLEFDEETKERNPQPNNPL